MSFTVSLAARANHYSGGSITYQCLGGNMFQVNLDLFLDCSGIASIPQDLTFTNTCGTTFTVAALPPPPPVEVSQLCAGSMASSTCNGGALPGIHYYHFQTVVNLAACDHWTISWNICCRSTAIDLVGNFGMYVEATLYNVTAPCNNSPVFTDQSLPYVCVNQPVYYNFGVTEPDGNALVYSLINARYYTGTINPVPYQGGYSGPAPVPGITLDAINGQIVFTPTLIGNYVVVIKVDEYDALGNLIGSVMRDIIFVVLPCTGSVPTTQGVTNNTAGILTSANSIEVCNGQPFCVDVVFNDADPGTILQVVSQATALLPGATFTVTGNDPATATICWTGDVNNSPVNVLIQADDGNCPIENSASIAVNITSVTGGVAPDPGISASIQVCPGSAIFNLLNSLTGTPDATGVWTDPLGNSHGAQFDPLTDPAGIYTYTVGNACAFATSTVTIGFFALPNAGMNGSIALCSNGVPALLFNNLGGSPAVGGTWTAPGGGAFSGTYDPILDNPGVYTYTVVGAGGCPGASATITVTETAAANAGTNGTLTICSTAPTVTLITYLGGAPQAGGTWTAPGGGPNGGNYNPVIHNPGVYTYTVIGTAPCGNATATVTVTENPPANAGTNGIFITCSSSAPNDLFTHLTGVPQAGGVWTAPGGGAHSNMYDPAVDASGVYTYTITGTPPCANATAMVTVTENAAANAGADGTLSICGNSAAAALFPLLTGAQAGGTWTAPGGGVFAGTYDPLVDFPGNYTYAVAGTAPCPNDQSIVTVNEFVPPNAGTDALLAICSLNAPTNLFTLLAGAQIGGTWTAPGGGAFSGVYDPIINVSGMYTYTLIGTAPCMNNQATITVTESQATNAGTDGVIPLCSNSAPTDLFTQLTGAQVGGTWLAPGGVAFGGTYDPSVNNAGIYTYTVNGTAPCPNDIATVTVTENPAANAGADAVFAICSNGAATSLFPMLVGAQVGGSWTAPGGGAFSGTYDPLVNNAGIYTYTVVGIAPCANDQATVTVTENAAPNAGVDGAITLCSNGATSNLFTQLIGAQAGGTWTAPGGGAFSGTYDPLVNNAGVYTYTIAGVAPCVNDQSIVTVTENVAPNAGADGAITLCSNGATSNLFVLLVGAQAGGTWTFGGVPHGANYDPAIDVSGIYTYTIAGIAPCTADQATVTVNETSSPNAGTDGVVTLCSNGAAIDLFMQLIGAQVGGSWTAPGGTAHSNTLDPATDVAGIYTYTLAATAPCMSDASQVTVTINAAPNAGADAMLTVCDQGAATSLFAQLVGAQAGGSWTFAGVPHGANYDPAVDVSGVYTYTVAGTAPCVADQATVTVNETSSPNAGTDGAITVCSNGAAIDLFAQLGGAQAGGAWTSGGVPHLNTLDPTTDIAGVYTYTIAATPPCVSDASQVTVTINTAPNAGTDGALTVCDQGAATSLFAQLIGAQVGGSWTFGGAPHGGNYDPAIDVSGVYTYTVADVAPCAADQATVTVNETSSPNAGTDGAITLCSNGAAIDLFAQLGGAQAGGAWTFGGVPHSSTLDPVSDLAGIYTYTIAATAPCVSDASQITVTINAAPNAGADGALTVCDQGAATSLFAQLIGAQVGGSWTFGGAPHGGNYDPAIDVSGVYTYTVADVAPCAADQSTVTVNETSSPNAGTDGAITLCSNGAVIDLFAQLGGAQVGGAWSFSGAPHSNTLDPATDLAGVYTYTIAATAPCVSDASQVTVTINAAPNAGADGALTVCDQGAATSLFAQLVGAQIGGSWTFGGAPHGANYDPLVDVSGVYTYTVAGVAPCAADQSTVTVNETSSPNAGVDGAITLCGNGTAIDLFAQLGGAQPGGAWTFGGVPHSNMLDPSIDVAGVYTYTIAATAPCTSASSIVTVTIETPPNAGLDNLLSVCTGDIPFALFAQLAGTPDAGGTWTDPMSNAFAGIFDPATSTQGTYTYSVSGIVCASASAHVTVSVSLGPNAGQDNAITLCSSDPPIALFSGLLGTPDPGGTWTDPNGVAFAGTFDPATSLIGTYTYTVASNSTCPDAQAIVTVAVNQAVNAGSIGIATLCSSSAPIALFNSLGGSPQPGGTWTDPSNAPFSGTFDPASDPQGVYTYTVIGAAPCPSAIASITVEVNTAPNAGNDASIIACSSDASITLFAQLGGTPDLGGSWTDPNGANNGGVFVPGSSTSGAYIYTVAGIAPCASDQAIITVSVSQAANAGSDGAITVCSNAASFALFPLLGGSPQAGGTWTDPNSIASTGIVDPAIALSGLYTYSVNAPLPCAADLATVLVDIVPLPQPNVSIVMDDGCAPVEVTFSSGYTGVGSCAWDFGNGLTSNDCTPDPVLYSNAGMYSISLTIDAGSGCTTTIDMTNSVQVFVPPVAAFSVNAPNINSNNPLASFINESIGASSYAWQFGTLGTSTETQPSFMFSDGVAGEYTVCLTAFASPNCFDTACHDIIIPIGVGIYIPNAFTPDGDGINETFRPIIAGMDPKYYHFYIFDRWGQPLFETADESAAWSGNFSNNDPVPEGVYVWKLVGKDRYSGDRIDRIGHVTLVR